MKELLQKLPLSPVEAQALLTRPGMPFETAVVEIDGRPTTVWKNAAASLRDVFLNTSNFGDALYLVYENERLSYRQHYARAAALARYLADQHGIAKGDRVAIAMRNQPEWVIAFWAIAVLGAVVVPLNAWWTGPELSYGLTDSGAKLAIVDQRRYHALGEHIAAHPDLIMIAAMERGEAQPAGTIAFAAVSQAGENLSLPDAEIGPEDDATLFYTSGTSGAPKGALGSQRNICSAIVAIAYAGVANELIDGKVPPALLGEKRAGIAMISVPFFHVTGCHAILMATTASGNALVIMRKWDPGRALELIEREKVTGFVGVPGMVWQLLEHPDLDQFDTSSLTAVSYGGAPAAPGLRHRFQEKLQQPSPRNSYGMTETSSLACSITGPCYLERPDSVGPPIPVIEFKIVDPDGKELPAGSVGELWMRGATVVKAYWNKPEATAATFTDGWLHSGDLAKLDADGFLYIVDRAKDMVIRGGENVYCVEVEDALYTHPDITDAAVVGRPHEVLGEEVAAVVQVKPDSALDAEGLQAYLHGRIANFKIPVAIQFQREPLPRNANGKIMKSELRSRF